MPLLVLQAPIHVGDRKWSQVWRGTLTSQDLPDVPPAPAVIKLFQASYLKDRPNTNDFWGDLDYAEWFPGARLAANEAWAYDCMRSLQGNFFTIQVIRYSTVTDSMASFAQAAPSLGHMGSARYLLSHRLGQAHKSPQCVLPNGTDDVCTCYGRDRWPYGLQGYRR
jgi:hypothetical protein